MASIGRRLLLPAILLGLVGACGSSLVKTTDDPDVSALAGDTSSTNAAEVAADDVDDQARIGCANGPYFPASALDAPPPLLEDSSVPEVSEAIEPFLASGEGEFWPQEGWRVLEIVDGERVELVSLGNRSDSGLAFMTAEWTDQGWQWAGSSSPNSCPLVLEPEPGINVVDWELDPAVGPPQPDATTLVLLATERACASGNAVGERLLEPRVSETNDAILIGLSAEPTNQAENCPSNPSQKVTIELDQPVGQRQIRDARATDLGDLQEVLSELIP